MVEGARAFIKQTYRWCCAYFFFAAAFFATGFFATAFFATGFFTTAFFAAGFFTAMPFLLTFSHLRPHYNHNRWYTPRRLAAATGMRSPNPVVRKARLSGACPL